MVLHRPLELAAVTGEVGVGKQIIGNLASAAAARGGWSGCGVRCRVHVVRGINVIWVEGEGVENDLF